MKVVFSRKGFDSQYGGIPSPILPDGRLLPLPIPSSGDHRAFSDVRSDDVDVGQIVEELSQGRKQSFTRKATVHLDPDLARRHDQRLSGWLPALGQTGAAQSHLRGCGIGPGDTFLFFGWFREISRASGVWKFVRDAPDLHVIFGWLEVGVTRSIVGPNNERESTLSEFPWLSDHPHLARPDHYTDRRNTIYVARQRSAFMDDGRHGAGLFPCLADSIRLTAPGAKKRSEWLLPSFLFPQASELAISYHGNMERWRMEPRGAILQAVAKGQEFVVSSDHYADLPPWVSNLVRSNAAASESMP